MGIDPASLTEQQLQLMTKADRKKLGKRGVTAAEALRSKSPGWSVKFTANFPAFVYVMRSMFAMRTHSGDPLLEPVSPISCAPETIDIYASNSRSVVISFPQFKNSDLPNS